MKRDWRRGLRNAISRNDHRSVVAGAVAGLGGAIAIGVMELFSFAAHYPLAVIPFATSIVLVIGSPDVEPAQPRALIGGHLISALVGLAVLKLTGPQAWAAAAAVGLAILAMYVTGTFHPPAGINPLLVVSGNLPSTFSVGAGAGRRGAVDRVFLCLAPRRAPPAMATALVVKSLSAKSGYAPSCRLAFPQGEVVAVAHQRHIALMEGFQRCAMTDRDNGCLRQFLRQHGVQRCFRGLVERRGGFIEEEVARCVQQRPRQAQPLLFAEREHAIPVRLFVQPRRQAAASPTFLEDLPRPCRR